MIGASNPPTTFAIDGSGRSSAALAERLLNFVLFITVLASSFVFVEPSPHDALMCLLLLTCITAYVKFDRKLVPLLLLLLVWMVGGALSLIQVGDEQKDIQYFATSFYLCIAAITFACLFSGGSLVRLAILQRAYIISALIATAAGYIGFFHLLPGADVFLDMSPSAGELFARVSSTFKDPNVYGPFLIYPMLLILMGFLTRGVRLGRLAILAFLLGGLFLSFSRGAWAHFAISATVCFVITLAATQDRRDRTRILMLGIAVAVAVALFSIALISIGTIHDMFVERAKAIQPYDVGPGGRFSLQRIAIGTILEHPNGLGPFEFARLFGVQQHNQYMQAFLVYGWLGGTTYIALVLVTLVMGLRMVRVPTPWQLYLIAAYGAFVGEVVEGMVVDTDHWRHFFLLLGLIWGLTVATINLHRQPRL